LLQHFDPILESFIGCFGLAIVGSEQEDLEQYIAKDDMGELEEDKKINLRMKLKL
jgi:hypothetical protein